MSPLLRLGILVFLSFFCWLLIWCGRRFVASRRRRALSSSTPADLFSQKAGEVRETLSARVNILAFSSEDCQQCHRLQAPALERVKNARGEVVSVIDIDATTSPELTKRYQILTVPSTVILDAAGKAHAVNYGFANTKQLLDQVDALL